MKRRGKEANINLLSIREREKKSERRGERERERKRGRSVVSTITFPRI